jgi:hypothetical protein
MPRRFLIGSALFLLVILGIGLLSFRSRAADLPSPVGPGNRLLGREPEPDAGPIPPGTPPQPAPRLFRGNEPAASDPMLEIRRLKRRAERTPGPLLGAATADLPRYRQLMEQLRGPSSALPHLPTLSLPSSPRGRSAHAASVAPSLWRDVVASPVAWGKIPLQAGHAVTIELRNVAGGQPLLYLIQGSRQVAFSGEGALPAGSAPSIRYTPTTDGDYQFLVRGVGDGSVGTGDLYVDGQPLFSSVRFGGTAVPAAWAAADEFQTAHLPAPQNPSVDTVLYAFDGRSQFVARNDDGGIAGCSRLVMSSTSTHPDAEILVASASQDPADGGPVRVYDNPLSQGDPDGDHLATPLEMELGTDPRAADTDGDGLRDDWEVFGVHTENGDEDLPSYSDPWTAGPAADPTRKDLFVELDWMGGPDGDPNHFRVTDEALQRLTNAMRDHGGVAVHLDMGQMGTRTSRGGQSIGYQSSFYFTDTHPHSMQDLWTDPDQFATSRGHLFAYGITVERFSLFQNTTGEMRRLFANGALTVDTSVWNPTLCPGFIICDGTGIYNQPAKQAAILMHEIGHCLHLHHGGNVDTNYKPNYLSVMNYLFALPTLSDTGDVDYSHGGLAALDETALNEIMGLGTAPSQHIYSLIQGQHRADVRTGTDPDAIDWNEDGAIDRGLVAVDINNDSVKELLTDFDDWQEARHPKRGFGWVGVNAGIESWNSSNDAP